MQIETKQIFRCDFCKKKMFIKKAMEKHEQFCQKNLANVPACFDCVYLTTSEIVEESHSYEAPDFTRKLPFVCSKKDQLIMHNKKSEVLKRRWIKDLESELMPSNCELQKKHSWCGSEGEEFPI